MRVNVIGGKVVFCLRLGGCLVLLYLFGTCLTLRSMLRLGVDLLTRIAEAVRGFYVACQGEDHFLIA